MRHFKLEIAKDNKEIAIDLETSYKNRTPLNIQFEVNSFQDGQMNTIGFVKVYNPAPQTFLKQKEYIGKQLTLWAGWENSVYLKKIGYEQIYNNLLLNVKVAGVTGEYVGLEPHLTFYYEAWSEEEIKDNKAQSSSLVKIQVPPNGPVVQIFIKALASFTSWKVIADAALMGVVNSSTQTLVMFCKSMTEALNWFSKTFEAKYSINSKTQVISLMKRELTKTEQKAQMIKDGLPLTLNAVEFLSQPQLLNVGGQYAATLRLRPDLRVNQHVKIGEGLVANLSSMTEGWVDARIMSDIQKSLSTLFYSGIAEIISVKHTGDYKNSSAEAWSTTIEFMLKEDSERAKVVAKAKAAAAKAKAAKEKAKATKDTAKGASKK